MKCVDAVVIGGGILGCFAARNLMRFQLSVLLLEEKEDFCTGITRANAAVVYAGYDNQPGSLKAEMTRRGNAGFEALCEELEVPFVRCGSLMVSFGPAADQVLQKKYQNGQKNNVSGLQILSGQEACELEPFLSVEVRSALYAPSTGTVNSWQLGIAACENAVYNGVEVQRNVAVKAIKKRKNEYIIETEQESIVCRAVLNCAGMFADKIQEMLFPPSVRLYLDGADFLVMDQDADAPKHVIFHESEESGKGITAVPCVEGNLLLASSQRPLEGTFFSTSVRGMQILRETAVSVLPKLEINRVIRSFGAVRPNPRRVVWQDGEYVPDGKSIGSFVIENPAPGFYSLLGIKTPGLTCAEELGRHLAQKTGDYLDALPNPAFDPKRKAIIRVRDLDFAGREQLIRENPDYAEIVCQCGEISKAEIMEAIRRGAVTADGVKRRVGTGMGVCQGSRCHRRIQELLEGAGCGTV